MGGGFIKGDAPSNEFYKEENPAFLNNAMF
jgi:hypothetical protein